MDHAAASAEVIRDDAAIDEAFRGMMRQLITYMMEDPRTLSTAFEIVWIARIHPEVHPASGPPRGRFARPSNPSTLELARISH